MHQQNLMDIFKKFQIKVSLKKGRGILFFFPQQRISSILYVFKLDGSFSEQSYY